MYGKSTRFWAQIHIPIWRWGIDIAVPGIPLRDQVILRWCARGTRALISWKKFRWSLFVLWLYFFLGYTAAGLIILIPLMVIDGIIWLFNHQPYFLETLLASNILFNILLWCLTIGTGLMLVGSKMGKPT